MILILEQKLRCFEFWGGSEELSNRLTDEELNSIDEQLQRFYPQGLSEWAINDLFCQSIVGISALIGETEKSILARKEIIK